MKFYNNYSFCKPEKKKNLIGKSSYFKKLAILKLKSDIRVEEAKLELLINKYLKDRSLIRNYSFFNNKYTINKPTIIPPIKPFKSLCPSPKNNKKKLLHNSFILKNSAIFLGTIKNK